jgi:hypothetical protein
LRRGCRGDEHGICAAREWVERAVHATGAGNIKLLKAALSLGLPAGLTKVALEQLGEHLRRIPRRIETSGSIS